MGKPDLSYLRNRRVDELLSSLGRVSSVIENSLNRELLLWSVMICRQETNLLNPFIIPVNVTMRSLFTEKRWLFSKVKICLLDGVCLLKEPCLHTC